jgi:hypothetical protein
MNPIMQEVKPHRKNREIIKAGVREDEPPPGGKKFTHPGFDLSSQLPNQEQPLLTR